MKIRNPEESRRAFLRATGIGAGLIPFLGTETALRAQEMPKRFLHVVSPNGWVHDTFLPSGAAGSLAGRTLPAGTSPLQPYLADVNFIAGLEYRNLRAFYPDTVDYVDCHHSLPHITSGVVGVMGNNSSSRPSDGIAGYHPAGGGATLDQWYADKLIARGINLPFPLVTAGIQCHSSSELTMSQFSYRGPDQPNAIENNPYNLNARLFANAGMSQTEVDRVRLERRSVLDYVGKNIDRFSKNLGTEDRVRVAQHLDSVRRIEASLQALVSATCKKPNVGSAINLDSQANVPMLISAQFDNIVAAMACDVTRSAGIGVNNGGGNWFPSWLNNPDFSGAPLAGNAGTDRNHHDLAHASGTQAEARRIKTILENWFMQQFAGLIKRLKEIPEGSGTMLDNTIILWTNNMGDGNHSWKSHVWVTAGGRGMGLKTGQYLPMGEWETRGQMGACVPQNGVLTAIANVLTGSNASSFGDARFGGEIAALRA